MMGPRRLLLVACVGLQLGCSSDPDSAQPSGAAPGQGHGAHKPLDDKAVQAPRAAVSFAYRAAGRRDPFRSYLLDAVARRQAEHSQRRVEETEAYELSQYHLTAVLTGTSQPKAMVEDPTGKAYVVRIGARLGRSGGRVSRIDSTGLQVLEESLDPQGLRAQVPVSLKLPVPTHDYSVPGLGATP